MKRIFCFSLLFALFTYSSALAAELQLYGAGSLAKVMGEMITEYEAVSGNTVKGSFGSSGLMREAVEQPGTGDIFTSANMGHAQQLQKLGRSLFVAEFTQNVLCAFGNEKAGITDQNILEKMLDPALKLGIFPSHDPSGEYALLMFKRAEAVQPGAEKALLDKAIVMEPGLLQGELPAGEDLLSQLMKQGTIDIYIAYANGAADALSKAGTPVSGVAQFPAELRVGVNYGLTVLKDAQPEAYQLGLFILSEKGQGILKRNGFAPIGLTD